MSYLILKKPWEPVKLLYPFFKKIFFFFLTRAIFKVFIKSATTLFLSHVLVFFGHEACRILTLQPGI